jgi:hypothetical protein
MAYVLPVWLEKLEPPPRRRGAKRHYLYAVLITLALVMAVGLSFRPQADDEGIAPPPRVQTGELVMLPLGERTATVQGWHRGLEAWTDLRDPTLISLPNDQYGFSEVLRQAFERPYRLLGEPDSLVPLAPAYDFPPAVLTAAPAVPLVVMDQSRLRQPETLPAAQEARPWTPGVYWTDELGQVLADVPPLALPEPAAGATPPTISRPTRLACLPRGQRLRVTLLESCGVPALDELAVTHLRRFLAPFADAQPPTLAMRDWLAGERQVVVHWRLAPQVRVGTDLTVPEEWHDRTWY